MAPIVPEPLRGIQWRADGAGGYDAGTGLFRTEY